MPVISVREILKPDACAKKRARLFCESCGASVTGALAAHRQRIDDGLLRMEVRARGLGRAGEELADLLEGAVVPGSRCRVGERFRRHDSRLSRGHAGPYDCDPRGCQVSGAKEMISRLSATEPRCVTISDIFSGG